MTTIILKYNGYTYVERGPWEQLKARLEQYGKVTPARWLELIAKDFDPMPKIFSCGRLV